MTETNVVWRVDVDDCDTVYVVAPDATKAKARGLAEWSNRHGIYEGDDEYESATREAKAKEDPRLTATGLSPRALVDLGLAVWECSRCGYHYEGGELEWHGNDAVCLDCLREKPVGVAITDQAIFLTSEW